jgi:long-chain acyl-CoA synthetase
MADGAQRVKAYVVPRPGTQLTKEELLELCHRRLEPYAVPWDIEFREELPKSFIGKVLRRLLVEESRMRSVIDDISHTS